MKNRLNRKQKKFIAEYLVDLNGTQAAIRAGYKANSADVHACRLLANAKIQAEVKSAQEIISKRNQVCQDDVIQELKRIAFVDIGQAYNPDGTLKPIDQIPGDVRRAISSIDVDELEEFDHESKQMVHLGFAKKIRLNDKIRALEMLGKHIKMFPDRHELGGRDGGPIKFEDANKMNLSAVDTATLLKIVDRLSGK